MEDPNADGPDRQELFGDFNRKTDDVDKGLKGQACRQAGRQAGTGENTVKSLNAKHLVHPNYLIRCFSHLHLFLAS